MTCCSRTDGKSGAGFSSACTALRSEELGVNGQRKREQTPVTAGRLRIEPGEIGAALEKIRRDTAALDRSRDIAAYGRAAPRMRVTLSNLVFLLSDHCPSISDAAIDDVLTELAVSHPSRFFVIQYHSHARAGCSEVETSVASRCVLANSGIHTCSEEVYMDVQPKTLPGVSNILLSLFLPDIDIVLLPLCDPVFTVSDEESVVRRSRYLTLLATIGSMSDVLVYDSSTFEDYELSLAQLIEEGQSARRHRDLNWGRTARWRSLIADQFDLPRFSEALAGLESLTLTCDVPSTALSCGRIPADALIVSSWMLAALGYCCFRRAEEEDEKALLVYARKQPGGVETAVRFKSSEASSARRLKSVEFAFPAARNLLKLKIENYPDKSSALLSCDIPSGGKKECEIDIRCAAFPQQPLSALIRVGVGMQGIDPEYLRTVETARNLARASKLRTS